MQIRTLKQKCLAYGALVALLACTLSAAEHKGQVKFGGLPVPGATVTATQGDKAVTAITDDQGKYSFPDLADGSWSIQVEMLGFTPLKQDVTVSAQATAPEFELKMLPFAEIAASAPPQQPPPKIRPRLPLPKPNPKRNPTPRNKPPGRRVKATPRPRPPATPASVAPT
jgi:hypothetical protein